MDAEVVDLNDGGADEGGDGKGGQSEEEEGAVGRRERLASAPGGDEEDEEDDAVEAEFEGGSGKEAGGVWRGRGRMWDERRRADARGGRAGWSRGY